MPGPILLLVNHEEMLDENGMEWSMNTEEVLGGVGRSGLVVQDRNNSWEPQAHWDVQVLVRATGWVLFRGEIVDISVKFEIGMPWRKWELDCADYNVEFPQRLVGAFNGKLWQDVDGLGDYVNIDPDAHSLDTDKLTVQNLFDAYIRVDGQAFETETFVGQFLSDFPMISWDYSDLQAVLEELASEITVNLQFWSDPDLFFHWVAIPAWQDLSQPIEAGTGVTGLTDPGSEESGFPALFPEGDNGLLPTAPVIVSDVRGGDQTGARDLQFDLDGSSMPEQIYVRGATGYTYDAPPVNPAGNTVVINPEGYGSRSTDHFRLTFLSSTKIWHTSGGLVLSSFHTASAGGPYDVKFVAYPYNRSNGKGGHFWKLLTGPDAGWLVDNDTNYFGYGSIKVEKFVEVAVTPTVGIGGSGFVDEVLQDKDKRQAYLEAPISTDRTKRDAIGEQALYRGSFPTLRGSMKVYGVDGWRVGQLVPVTDDRLPSYLNGRFFVIQRVRAALIEATAMRTYVIDWGDGPTSRYTNQVPRGGGDVRFPPPAVRVVISTHDLSPGPNSKQTIVGQLTTKAGGPWEIAGKVVKWTLEVYNAAGTLIPNQGTLVPLVSATDAHGRARTVLTTGATAGLVYFVFADVPVE